MANTVQNGKVISKNNAGFPDYLNFEKLRKEGIEHLGLLAGKIWTDHNVHDPGITILEVLCYSLLDLGYRTNLPAIDIFTPAPSATGGRDDNFFTAAEILACNPVTVMDYRKLLLDIEGVKNAWLSIATEEQVNGLYHVYIEPEKNITSDFSNEESGKTYLDDLISRIREVLMGHRNLCEDFVDIYILCKLEMGVTATIELEEGADIEKTYLGIAEQLRAFFSPSPKFYTLQQLLDKNHPVEDIFAGRPYSAADSHGFIDTTELEQIILKKEIHLSDVYNEIFKTKGVVRITGLAVNSCKDGIKNTSSSWKVKLPENHVPDFSMACSSLRFTRKGLPLSFDPEKYAGLLEVNFSHTGKLLYKGASPYLDQEIPRGIYHSDLDQYYLLQDDFPRVYGIAEGGLAEDAATLRKAQALQLKGYLLFFDQLLAGYLSQLKNIRALFSPSGTADKSKQHTYFLNQLEKMPEVAKLLRFAVTGKDSNALGEEGSTLVRPVSKTMFYELISSNANGTADPGLLPSFTFSSPVALDIAVNQLKDDLHAGSYTTALINQGSTCIYYFISSSSDDFVLLSKKSFPTTDAADFQLHSVTYIGTFEENYQTYMKDADNFSFDILLKTLSFTDYLQKIVEGDQLYATRRTLFLDHLLARFAERFTDHALFTYYKESPVEEGLSKIRAKEDFLVNYDTISANRGRGYNYLENIRHHDNQSGLETEVKFLSGMTDKNVHTLCDFVVERYDDQYLAELKIADSPFFSLSEKFISADEAAAAVHSLYTTLPDLSKSHSQYLPEEKLYTIQVQYSDRNTATFAEKFKTSQEADAVRTNLSRMFSVQPDRKEVFISSYLHKLQLLDNQGNIVRNTVASFKSNNQSVAVRQKLAGQINDPAIWLDTHKPKKKISPLYLNTSSAGKLGYIAVDAFKITINNSIVGRPELFTYTLMDGKNNFKLYPVPSFDTEKEALLHAHRVLGLATLAENYTLTGNAENGSYQLAISSGESAAASCDAVFAAKEEALKMQEQIISLVKQHEFTMRTMAYPNAWKFNFKLGHYNDEVYQFTSKEDYPSEENAVQALTAFQAAVPEVNVQSAESGIVLTGTAKDSNVPELHLASAVKGAAKKLPEKIGKALAQQKDILRIAVAGSKEAFKSYVKLEDTGNEGDYVYRLVDKDNVLAFYRDTYSDLQTADLGRRNVARLLRRNPRYLQLCLGGDIVHEITEGQLTFYRYQLKAQGYLYRSGDQKGKEMVLFESMVAYATRELAEAAFESNYLLVLQLAAAVENYGTAISLTAPSQGSQGKAASSKMQVFVPDITQKEILNSGESDIARFLSLLAKSYPVKSVSYGTVAFNHLFCETEDPAATDPCKTGTERQTVYYFGTYQQEKDPQQWQSMKYYNSAAEAMTEFLFFMRLLQYAGNLYVDCNHCDHKNGPSYRIYLREVLAESSRKFIDEAAAWGEQGVEQFICALQSGIGLHQYQRKEDCNYSFYLNCGEELVVHPCNYPTAKRRNEVLGDLYLQFDRFKGKRSWSLKQGKEGMILLDEEGRPFAAQLDDQRDEQRFCEWMIEVIAIIRDNSNQYTEKEGKYFLHDSAGRSVLQSYQKQEDLVQWKEKLVSFACYFPVVKKTDPKTGENKYVIALKLPGFTACGAEETEVDACGCDNKGEEVEPQCYLAWKSFCSYSSCDQAWEALTRVYELLAVFKNYQAVQDCSCNQFGIAIKGNKIAFNPQHYESIQMTCQAVERTKKLTKAYGLYLAEHILLRPRCREDRACRENISQQGDLYSFQATVVLPAWPDKFRNAEGRMFMEDMIHKLAPAQVWVCILWLTPKDMYDFEYHYKNWRRWLALQQTCGTATALCDFLEFLFKRNFADLDDCRSCLPCQEKNRDREPIDRMNNG